jgi:hypothetical protein
MRCNIKMLLQLLLQRGFGQGWFPQQRKAARAGGSTAGCRTAAAGAGTSVWRAAASG